MTGRGAISVGAAQRVPVAFGNFWAKPWSYILGWVFSVSFSVAKEDADGSAADLQRQVDLADIADFKAGREAGFNRLVLRYKDKVYSQCFRLLGHREEALDVAQDVFVRVYKGLFQFRGDAQFSTWLYTIALNACRNRQSSSAWRARQQSQVLEEGDELLAAKAQGGDLEWNSISSSPKQEWTSGSPADDLLRKRREALLQGALNSLPNDFREAMVLRDVEGRSYEDIAVMTGWEIGTVRSRIFRAREKLRDLLQKGWE